MEVLHYLLWNHAANNNHTTNNYYGQKCDRVVQHIDVVQAQKQTKRQSFRDCDERWYADSNAPPGHLCEQSSNQHQVFVVH